MKCLACKKPLPEPVHPKRKYCDSTCRSAACRARKAQRSTTDDSPGTKRSSKPLRQIAAPRKTELEGAQRPAPKARRSPRRHTLPPLRIPMEQQLLAQAPTGAVAYRLVLPPSKGETAPRFSPPIDLSGRMGSWSLTPFQPPDDIHLFDGQMYRVLWISADGDIIPPKQDGVLPGLRFVLGPVDPEATADIDRRDGGSPTETLPAPSGEQTTDAHGPTSELETRQTPERSEQEPVSELLTAPSVSTPEAAPVVPQDTPPQKSEAERRSEAYAIAESLTASAKAKAGNNSDGNWTPWTAPPEWQQETLAKPLWDALQLLTEVRDLAPNLGQDAGGLDEKAKSSFERFCAKLHEEISQVAALAKAQLTSDMPASILAEQTLMLITNHVFRMIDRWDVLLGVTTQESAVRESISKLSANYLGRVRSVLLLWLANQGISVDVPKTQVFTKERHHLLAKTEGMGHVLSGLITGVARAGYWQNGKLLRRAHVVVAK